MAKGFIVFVVSLPLVCRRPEHFDRPALCRPVHIGVRAGKGRWCRVRLASGTGTAPSLRSWGVGPVSSTEAVPSLRRLRYWRPAGATCSWAGAQVDRTIGIWAVTRSILWQCAVTVRHSPQLVAVWIAVTGVHSAVHIVPNTVTAVARTATVNNCSEWMLCAPVGRVAGAMWMNRYRGMVGGGRISFNSKPTKQ